MIRLLSPYSDYGQTSSSFIGIAVAIGGNILISLALNCQKLAHKRLETECKHSTINDDDQRHRAHEERPLLRTPNTTTTNYGLTSSSDPNPTSTVTIRSEGRYVTGRPSTPSEASFEELSRLRCRSTHGYKSPGPGSIAESSQGNETDYLQSKLWWFGFLLMNIGECGNFLSYAYAPASVVAPLGTVALIANCFFAPLMLKETLRKEDILGILLSVFGAATIVAAGRTKEVQLDVDGLREAVSRRIFIIYAVSCLTLIICLSILSASRAGRKWVFVDVGLCAVFGGFTVLSTKALSTFISLYWIDIFKYWIIYPVIAILLFTGIGQVLYLNRALKKFDSKVVIPTFFISFNLSAIIGSAILYEEFRDVDIHRLTTFFYGCLTTFLGVYFLTRPTINSAASVDPPDESHLEAADTVPNNVRVPAASRQPLQHRTSLVFSAGQYLLIASSPIREGEWTSDIRTTTSAANTPVKTPPVSS